MVLSSMLQAAVEHMNGSSEHFDHHEQQKNLNKLIVVAFWLVLVLMVGKWLWNNVGVKVTTVLKPLNSIWQLLGLVVLVDMIHPACCNM